MVLAMIFEWVCDKLCSIGRQIGIPTLLFLFMVIGLIFIGPFEGNTIKMNNGTRFHIFSQLKFEKYEIVFPESISSFKTNQFSPTEPSSCPGGEFLESSLENCPTTISAFTSNDFAMASQMQCTMVEDQNLHTMEDSKDSKCSLPESSNTSQELQLVLGNVVSVCTHSSKLENICEIKQGDSSLKTLKDESGNVVEEDTLAISKGKVNGGLVWRSYYKLSTWCSNLKAYVVNGGLRDKTGLNHLQVFLTNVFLLEFLLSLLILLLSLVDVLFTLIGRMMGNGIPVSIIIFTLGFVVKFIEVPFPTLYEYDYATLIYVAGHFHIFLALILEQQERRQLSHLFTGSGRFFPSQRSLGNSLHVIK